MPEGTTWMKSGSEIAEMGEDDGFVVGDLEACNLRNEGLELYNTCSVETKFVFYVTK